MKEVKRVKVGNFTFGDGHIYIQSMLNVSSEDIEGSCTRKSRLRNSTCGYS